MTIKTTIALTVTVVAMIFSATLGEAAQQPSQQQRNRDREAAQPQNFAPKAVTAEEQAAFVALSGMQDPNAKVAAGDAFLAKYPASLLAGYVNRFRMESYIATGKFKEAMTAGEAGLALETKYIEDLVKRADADAANKQRDRNAPPPIDKNSEAFKTYVADHGRTEMYYYQNLMRAGQELNDSAKIMEYGEKALARSPGDLFSLITVGNVMARRVPSEEKAEEQLKRAEDLNKRAVAQVTALVNGPTSAAMPPTQKAELVSTVNVSMGLVYFRQKKYEDAQKSYEAAVAANKTDAEAYMLLGMAQANQKPPKVDQAMDNLAKSVYLKGDTEKQARESLTGIYQATKKSLDGLDQFIQTAGSKIQQ